MNEEKTYDEAMRHYRTCMAKGLAQDAVTAIDIAIENRPCEEALPELVRLRTEALRRCPRTIWERLVALGA